MNKITVWSCWNNKKKNFEHNHIQDNWVKQDIPIPRFSLQKSWLNKKWKKEFCYLINHKVIRIRGNNE